MKTFTVIVADNFHYMDEGEFYEHGNFDTLEAAIAASKVIVDSYLSSALKPGMTAEQLYQSYTMFGEDPFIRGADDYAKERCAELCRGNIT